MLPSQTVQDLAHLAMESETCTDVTDDAGSDGEWDMSEHNVSRDRSEHTVSGDRSEHTVSGDRSEHNVSRDRSEHNDSRDRSEHNVSRDRSEHNVSRDRSEHTVSGDRSEHNVSGDRSEHNDSGDRSEHNVSQDRSEHNVSRDMSEHNVSRDMSERNVSGDKSEHNASGDRSEHSAISISTGLVSHGQSSRNSSKPSSLPSFEYMINNNLYSDVSILVAQNGCRGQDSCSSSSNTRDMRTTTVRAHKVILHVQCLELLNLCEGDCIDLSDYEEQAVLSLLAFIYTGSGGVWLIPEYQDQVLQLAQRFSLDGLCEEVLSASPQKPEVIGSVVTSDMPTETRPSHAPNFFSEVGAGTSRTVVEEERDLLFSQRTQQKLHDAERINQERPGEKLNSPAIKEELTSAVVEVSTEC
ncbi:hypothetical protein EGW08_017203, partial [Elysia chlorotica]